MNDTHPDDHADRPDDEMGRRSERTLLAALAVCCAGPMLLIIVLTSVLGIAIGPAAAIAIGVVAAGVCVVVMIQHHRRHR